jgi:hypothetical protein
MKRKTVRKKPFLPQNGLVSTQGDETVIKERGDVWAQVLPDWHRLRPTVAKIRRK